MPQRAYTYALPKSLADEHGLRRYGAHGTSYRFLTRKAAQVMLAQKAISSPEHLTAPMCHMMGDITATVVRIGWVGASGMGMPMLRADDGEWASTSFAEIWRVLRACTEYVCTVTAGAGQR